MNREYEPEIDLKELFFYILRRWRSIILVTVIFGVLTCGYKIAGKVINTSEEDGKSKEIRIYELQLEEYEAAKTVYERNIEDYQMRLTQQETYWRESVLMQTDPYNVPTASANIFVKLSDTEWASLPDNPNLDPTDGIISMYVSNFLSTIDWEPIETLTGKSALYLKELISVNTDYNSNIFTIWVRYSDGNTAQQILEIIVNQVRARYQDMDASVSRHSISVMNQTLAYSIDNSLADTQKRNADAIADYEQNIINCRMELEELEQPSPPSGIKKFAILCFAAAMFAMIAFYGMKYILDGKLHARYELTKRYNYQLLGIVPRPEKKGFLCVIDRFLGTLDGMDRLPGKEEAYRIIAANIINLAGKYNNILIASTLEKDKLKEVTDALTPRLDGITLTCAGNMNVTASALKELASCDSVILIEEKDASFMEDIQRQQDCIVALDKTVAGYVLLL